MTAEDAHRQLLVCCSVRNRAGTTSVRFVEHDLYRLWEYMMAHKHGLVVEASTVCLWMPVAEWRAQSELFQRTGACVPVYRLGLSIYDETTGFCNTVQRFAGGNDIDIVKDRLRGRLPAGPDSACHVAQDPGFAILRDDLEDFIALGYSLEEPILC